MSQCIYCDKLTGSVFDFCNDCYRNIPIKVQALVKNLQQEILKLQNKINQLEENNHVIKG